MITLYRAGNSTVDYQCVLELADYCGLKAAELISFRVERLVIHELLVRVTSDLSVPDGPNYEDLGINLRSMVSTIYQRHIESLKVSMNESFLSRGSTCSSFQSQR